MSQAVIQRSFLAGEVSPALAARADLRLYATGLALCKNCWVKREGGVVNRPGTQYLRTAGVPGSAVRLMPFIFEGADQTYVIEMGDGYFRWLWHGDRVVVTSATAWSPVTAYVPGDLAEDLGVFYYCVLAHTNQAPPDATYWHPQPVEDSAAVFEVPTPYAAADLAGLKWSQSADVLTLTHTSYPPRELRRLDHTQWDFLVVSTTPSIAAPQNAVGFAGTGGTRTLRYVVTAAKVDTYEESLGSTPVVVTLAATPTPETPQTVAWDAVVDAAEYYVYADPYNNGIYGLIGVTGLSGGVPGFNDVGFTPDFTSTPPIGRTLFAAPDDYPGVSTYYQQRRWFARSINEPETVWGSRTGAYANFSISTPLQDDDAVEFVIAARELNPVAHLLSLKRMIVLSDSAEWIVRGDLDNGAVTPSAINPDQQGFVGAHANVRPLMIGNGLVFLQARGNVIRDLRFEVEQATLGGRDLTIAATHLFEGYTIVATAWQQQPTMILWAVRSDGVLLACTYVEDEDIVAWSRHTTGATGVIEDVVVIPDTTAGEDVVYLVVQRTINSVVTRYLERLNSRAAADQNLTDAIFMDAALTYDGVPSTAMMGLDHLEGEVVAVIADGVVLFDGDPTDASASTYTVTGGAITLPSARSVVHIGIPIRFAEIATLNPDADGSDVRDKKKRVAGVSVVLDRSDPILLAGPDAAYLTQAKLEPWQTAGTLLTGDIEVTIDARWNKNGQVHLRHTDPLPWHVVAVIPQIELGG